ncbi:MAG: hypothetical protein ACTSWC_09515 [Promethearchaeota archaeon]
MILAAFSQIDQILQVPTMTPAEYLAFHPWLAIKVDELESIRLIGILR